MNVSMRLIPGILLIFLLLSAQCVKAQSEYDQMLECMLASSHWKDFYCRDIDNKIQLVSIITQNKIPVYEQLRLNNQTVSMRTSALKSERFLLYIRKIKIQDDFVNLKVLYDKRIRATFRLRRNDMGEWFVASSTIKQQYACEGKVKKKSFVWNF